MTEAHRRLVFGPFDLFSSWGKSLSLTRGLGARLLSFLSSAEHEDAASPYLVVWIGGLGLEPWFLSRVNGTSLYLQTTNPSHQLEGS